MEFFAEGLVKLSGIHANHQVVYVFFELADVLEATVNAVFHGFLDAMPGVHQRLLAQIMAEH